MPSDAFPGLPALSLQCEPPDDAQLHFPFRFHVHLPRPAPLPRLPRLLALLFAQALGAQLDVVHFPTRERFERERREQFDALLGAPEHAARLG